MSCFSVQQSRHERPSRIIRLAVVLFAVFLTADDAAAQGDSPPADFPGLDIQMAAGFEGVWGTDGPLPIAFLCSNFSGQPIEGTLKLIDDDETVADIVLGDVFIGAQATRRISFICDVGTRTSAIAVLEGRDQIYWQRPLSLITGNSQSVPFSEQVRYCLVVDDSGQSADLTPPKAEGDGTATLAEKCGGARIDTLTIPGWQLPEHVGPLAMIRTIVLTRAAESARINRLQWQAIGRWVCMGGTLLLPGDDDSVYTDFVAGIPLMPLPEQPFGELRSRACGAGRVVFYADDLFDGDSSVTRDLVARMTSISSGFEGIRMARGLQESFGRTGGSNASRTRLYVLGLLMLYTVLSGPITLAMFRMSATKIRTWLVLLVVATSLGAVVVASRLKAQRGDLVWVTISQPAAGGLVRFGTIDVQSAGGRLAQVAAEGQQPMLVDGGTVPRRRYYGWGNQSRPDRFAPFNTTAGADDPQAAASDTETIADTTVTLSPWGQRRLMLLDFAAESGGLDFNVTWSPPRESEGVPVSGASSFEGTNRSIGSFVVEITNRYSFDIRSPQLIVGVPVIDAARGNRWADSEGGDPVSDLASIVTHYREADLANIPAGTTTSRVADFGGTLGGGYYHSGQTVRLESAALPMPQAPYAGSCVLYVAGLIDEPDGLRIRSDRTDFDERAASHVFVARIPEENLPPEWLRLCREQTLQMLEILAEEKEAESSP